MAQKDLDLRCVAKNSCDREHAGSVLMMALSQECGYPFIAGGKILQGMDHPTDHNWAQCFWGSNHPPKKTCWRSLPSGDPIDPQDDPMIRWMILQSSYKWKIMETEVPVIRSVGAKKNRAPDSCRAPLGCATTLRHGSPKELRETWQFLLLSFFPQVGKV